MSRSIFTTLTALLLTTTMVHAAPSTYIVGGQQAAAGDFPYFVEMGGCGGALIAPDAVLFAAHCGNYNGKEIIIGSYHATTLEAGADSRFCDEWLQHPGWSENGENEVNWDIAVCKLDVPIEINETSVKLEWDDVDLNDGDNLIVMGYGALEQGEDGPEYIHAVTVPYVPNDQCNDMYNNDITEQMLCAGLEAGGKDSCQGDSGGPIVKRVDQGDGSFIDYHVGVVSWGAGCANPNKPGVYARTSEARPWLIDTLCNSFNSVASFCNNNNDNSSDPVAACAGGAELDIQVATDQYGGENAWSLKNAETGDRIMTRQYILPYNDNNHTVCVETSTCYNFNITDTFGDGMCSDGECGFYALRTPGQENAFARGGNFEIFETTSFCIDNDGNAVDELPPPLPEVSSSSSSSSDDGNGNGRNRGKTAKKAKKAGKAGKTNKKTRRVRHVRTRERQ